MMTTDDLQARIAELEVLQRRTQVIAQINAALSTATDEQGILAPIATFAEQQGVAGSALAYPITDETGAVVGARVVAMQLQGQAVAVSDALPTDEFPLDANPILRIALENPDEPLFVENVFTDPRMETGMTRDAFRHTGMTATIILWFQAAGQIQGVITLNWIGQQPFNEEVRAVFKAAQPVAAAAIANRRLMLELEKLAEEQSRAASLFKRLVENSIDSIFITNLQTEQLVYANQATYNLYGYDAASQELLDMSAMALWPETDISYMRQELTPAIMQGGWSGEIRQQRKSGGQFDASATAFVIFNDDGTPSQMCTILRDVTAQKQAEAESQRLQQQIIEAQRQALAELSTPIIPIMDRIIVMPLVGGIDTGRSRDIMRSLLEGISRYRAQIAILDITGVPVVDSGVADHLNRTMQAARLKGAQTIITGVSDAVAETIVDLGIDWTGFETLRDLQTGLITALDRLGIQLHVKNGRDNNVSGSSR